MRKYIFILFLLPLACLGQNLVPNPSFETYSSCPTGYAQINLATAWIDPTSSSSDYFNACCTNPNADSPNNFPTGGGFQFPRTGNGYAGLLAFVPFSREYVQVQLVDTLTSGVMYRVEFYVNLRNFQKYAIDAIGAYLSPTAVTGSVASVLNYTPQVSNSIGNYLTDTLNWMQIAGTFIATGGEKYITIGNFKSDSLTNKIIVNNSAFDTLSSYYYIDDVQVYPDSVTSIMQLQKNNSVSVYPNPAKDELFISVNDKEIKSAFVEITDITGKVVYSSEISIDEMVGKLNLNIDNGVYLVSISDSSTKKLATQKIIISK